MGFRRRFTANSQSLLLGVALILTAVLAMSVQDVLVKRLSSELTLWQIFALRGMLAAAMLIVVCTVYRGGSNILKAALGHWVLTRSLLMTIALLAFYSAIPFVSLATAGAALYVAPVFVLLLSAYLAKEKLRPLGWMGVLIGFAGVIVLLGPGKEVLTLWTLLPLTGAAFYAVSHVVTRMKCQQVPVASMALSLNLVMLLAGLLVSCVLQLHNPQGLVAQAHPYLLSTWSAIGPTDWLLLSVLAGLAVIIGMMLARAYQVASPSVVATFEYSYLIFAAIWDFLIFQIIPTETSIIGMLLIVFAGVMVVRYNTDLIVTDQTRGPQSYVLPVR